MDRKLSAIAPEAGGLGEQVCSADPKNSVHFTRVTAIQAQAARMRCEWLQPGLAKNCHESS